MAFKKAQPKQAHLKLMIYGPTGCGKTFTSLLVAEGLAKRCGKRVAFVDTEYAGGGSDFYAQEVHQRKVHPASFDFDRVETKSLAVCVKEIHALDPETHGVVVIDSLSALWQAAMDAYEGKKVGRDQDKIPIHAWGKIKAPFKGSLIQWLIEAPFHVIVCSRQKNQYDTTGGDWTLSRVAPRVEGETEYEFPLVWRMFEHRDDKGAASAWMAVAEKDRTGILSGRIIKNPSFSTVEPILELLGTESHPPEDEDERLSADADLIDEKSKAKESKSAALVDEYTAKIAQAASMAEMEVIAVELKKKKRSLIDEDHAQLVETWEKKRARIQKED